MFLRMAELKLIEGGRIWKPDEETTEEDLKKGFILDSSHTCENCIELPPEPEWFTDWFEDFWKYHRKL